MIPFGQVSRSLTTDIAVSKQPFGNLEFGVDISACSQPVVPDSDEPGRRSMQQEPAQELDRMESQFAGHFSGCIVSDREGDLIIIESKQPLVGDCYPMGVAAQVFEDLLRPTERCFGEDDPVGSVKLVFQ